MKPRILVADDHALFAEALTRVLNEKYQVVEVVRDGKALQVSARLNRPDIIITDITMPLMNGLDCVRSLRKDSYVPKIIFLTMHVDSELARECFNSGGSAFVTKESCYDEIVVAIEAVLANHTYVTPGIAAGLIDGLRDPATTDQQQESLTLRQREILQLFAEGKTMKEIATITTLSTRTVEWHKYRMMKLLRVRHSSELVQHALKLKLVA